jgi:putative DNA primase/helicase
MIANGLGKSRSSTSGTLLLRYQWRVSFLSTGELSLASKVSEDGLRSTAGQEVRVIDIPADAGLGMGLFEKLHEFSQPSDFADAIRDAAKHHYGHAARIFLAELVKDVPGLTSRVRKRIETIINEICPEAADGQVRRVAQRFALTACAGELATSFSVLPWEREAASRAARRCFNDWLQSRGSAGKKEEIDAIEATIGFLQRYSSRFRPWNNSDIVIPDCAGYVDVSSEGRTFYVFRDVFKKDICGKHGLDPEAAADTLALRKYLQKSSDGKRTRSERLPIEGKQRVYVIKMQEEGS